MKLYCAREGCLASTAYIAIFSSSEARHVAGRLQDVLADEGFVAKHWSELVPPGLPIIESVTSAVAKASAAIVITTPDTEVKRGDAVRPSAAGNLLFELGLCVANLGPERTFIVRPARADLELPSDLGGLRWVEYADGPTQADRNRSLGTAGREIADALFAQGQPRSSSKMSWHAYFTYVDALAGLTRERPVRGGFQPHAVIAVNPGGAMVGGLLYFRTGRRAFRLAGLFPRAQSRAVMVQITDHLVQRAVGHLDEGETLAVLVVDASIKSGKSMHDALDAVRAALDGHEYDLRTAVLVDVPEMREPAYEHEPDFVITTEHDEFPYGSV